MGKVKLIVLEVLNEAQKNKLSEICSEVTSPQATPVNKKNFFQQLFVPFKLLMPFLMSGYELNGRLSYIQHYRSQKKMDINRLAFHWFFFWYQFKHSFPYEVYRLSKNMHTLHDEINLATLNPRHIIFADFNFFIPYLKSNISFHKNNIVGNSHNAEFDVLLQATASEKNPIKLKWIKHQYKLMKQAEKKSLQHADKTFCCSDADKKKYLELQPGATIDVVPNGVDDTYFIPPAHASSEKILLFTGSMGYAPNAEAVQWFTNEILPLVLKKNPAVVFKIAGKDANLLAMQPHSNISIYANPEDMRPLFETAMVVVVPLKQGGGTRLKILEAAAMKLPVVSTTLGAEGINGLNSSNVLLADTAEGFATAIVSLLNDKAFRLRLSENLHTLVCTNYTWRSISANIKDAMLFTEHKFEAGCRQPIA